MEYKLRNYQQEAVDAGLSYLKKQGTPKLIVQGVGSGKSLVISKLAQEFPHPVIVLQPSKELLEQNFEKFLSFGGEGTICSASMKSREISHTTYATIGSVRHNVQEFKSLGVETVIIDEAHLMSPPEKGSMFRDFIDELKPKNILGFTATPFRLKTYGAMNATYSQLNMLMRIKPKVYTDIIYTTQVQQLMEEKYWAEIKYELWDFDDSMLRLNSTGAEFTESSISAAILKNNINTNIVNRAKNIISEGKSCLIFTDSVANAEIMASILPKSACVSATTDKKEREEIITQFKSGELKCIINYATLATGFDYPGLDYVIIGRPSNSYNVIYQMMGRVIRNPLYPLQKTAHIIDMCNNVKRFGKIEDLEIKYYEGYGWAGTANGQLLTGIPMGTKVMLKDVIKAAPRVMKVEEYVLTFGKHKGSTIKELPLDYVSWLYNNIDDFTMFNKAEKSDLKSYMIEIMTSDVKPIKTDETKLIIMDLNNVAFSLEKRGKLSDEAFNLFADELRLKFGTHNLMVVKDSSRETYWRRQIYPEYKGTRQYAELPQSFIDGMKQIVKNCNVKIVDGLEADDIIADEVRSGKYQNVYVISSDSDFDQLGFFKCFVRVDTKNYTTQKVTQRQAVLSMITKILKGDAKDNVLKCHNEKMIKTNLLNMVSDRVFTRLLNYCKTGLCSDPNILPLNKIIWEELDKTFKMDKEKYELNYRLICLIQNCRS